MPARPRPRVSPARASVSVASDAIDALDLKCVLYLHTERARVGCGDPKCPVETCSIARQARLVLRAFDALAAANARTAPTSEIVPA